MKQHPEEKMSKRVSAASPLCCYSLLFPRKLQRILSDAETNEGEGWDKIISWVPDGKGFKIHNTKKFAAEIMPRYFGSSKFRTFQRSLNLWDFKTPLSGEDRGVCSHPMFQRDAPDLCENMKRTVKKKKSINHKQKAGGEMTVIPSKHQSTKVKERTSSTLLVSPPPSPPPPALSTTYLPDKADDSGENTVVFPPRISSNPQHSPSLNALVELEALALILKKNREDAAQNKRLFSAPRQEQELPRTSTSDIASGTGLSIFSDSLPRTVVAAAAPVKEPTTTTKRGGNVNGQRLYSMFAAGAASSSSSNFGGNGTTSIMDGSGTRRAPVPRQQPVFSSCTSKPSSYYYAASSPQLLGGVPTTTTAENASSTGGRQALRELLLDQAARLLVGVDRIEDLLARNKLTSLLPPSSSRTLLQQRHHDQQQQHAASGYLY